MRRISKSSSTTTNEWVGFLKAPTPKSGRATFAIIKRKQVDGKSVNETFQSEALTSINAQFKAGLLSFAQARQLAKDIVDQINFKSAVQYTEANLELLNKYWAKEYENRDIVDRRSAKNRLVRAIEAIGHYSLLSASREELQTEIDQRFKGNKQRNVVDALNQLLKFFKRDIKLRRGREEVREVPYVTEKELRKILTHIEEPHLRLMHEVAFATGLRAGELFGLLPQHVKETHVEVSSQIDVSRVRRETKNRKVRTAVIITGYLAAVRTWSQIPLEDRLKFRKRSIAKLTRKVSKKAINRSISFHDLRHSYAVYLVSHEVSLTNVAQFLGDSVRVAERYYSGFVATPESIANAIARMAR